MDWTDYLRFIAALLFVLALMGGLWILLKRLGLSGVPMTSGQRRLKIIETLSIDARRRVIILQRDDKQHLVILGPTGETVIESDIAHEPAGK